MTNNKQSSVEWYIEKIRDLDYEYAKGLINLGVWSKRKNALIEQAKAMHKEEHRETWDKSMENFEARGRNEMRAWVDFDEYYEQTYESNS